MSVAARRRYSDCRREPGRRRGLAATPVIRVGSGRIACAPHLPRTLCRPQGAADFQLILFSTEYFVRPLSRARPLELEVAPEGAVRLART